MKLGKYSQTPSEDKLYTVDYSQWLAAGEILNSVTYQVTPVTSPPLAVSNSAIAPSPNSTSLSFYISGGTDGTTYKVVVQVTTSLGQVKDDEVFYAVKNA